MPFETLKESVSKPAIAGTRLRPQASTEWKMLKHFPFMPFETLKESVSKPAIAGTRLRP